jgi:hypothetical protein
VKRSLGRRPVLLFVAGLFAVGCATMLELDGYDDAVTLLCQCPGFETVEDCADDANKRLAVGSDGDRREWLDEFQDKQCGNVCDRAAECYGAVPGCQEKRAGCECCSWTDDKLTCTTGICAACRTCSDVATGSGSGGVCVTGNAILGDLRRCACEACPDDCATFCQGTGDLGTDFVSACSDCLGGTCQSLLTACKSDKP